MIVIWYFTNRGSKVYVAFLDATKAFDRISHYGLFSKLIERQIPLCLLMCLIFWYENMVSCVRWGSAKRDKFPVQLGIKQGGINSPDFFSCYIDGKCVRAGWCWPRPASAAARGQAGRGGPGRFNSPHERDVF